MNTTKHTPGPWNVQPWQWNQGASLAIVAPNNGYIVAIVPFDDDIQMEDEPDCNTVKRHPGEIPNANMLAAAPAMYEALRRLHDVLDTRLPSGLAVNQVLPKELFDLFYGPAIEARQALAQAEGK